VYDAQPGPRPAFPSRIEAALSSNHGISLVPCPSPPPIPQGSDVVFAKSYRGDVLLTVIWYGPGAACYISLAPAGGEEQALVDTLFPSIYGACGGGGGGGGGGV
jgi:hypothetical protein